MYTDHLALQSFVVSAATGCVQTVQALHCQLERRSSKIHLRVRRRLAAASAHLVHELSALSALLLRSSSSKTRDNVDTGYQTAL
jgi:hypothetical protein